MKRCARSDPKNLTKTCNKGFPILMMYETCREKLDVCHSWNF